MIFAAIGVWNAPNVMLGHTSDYPLAIIKNLSA